jgi:hypothetical protein
MGWPGGDCCDEAAEDWRCYHYADLQGGLVCAVLDDLVVALYGTVDELLGKRSRPGRPPRLSDTELVCLAVAQVPLAATASAAGCGSSVTACVTCSPMSRAWRQTHVAGPTDLRTAPLPAHNYVGEYQGLAGLPRGRGFAAAFTLAAPQAKDGPTDIFFARIGPGR